MKIEKVSAIILVNNSMDESDLLAEHGLAILLRIVIDGEEKEILLDTGKSGEVLLNNINKLQIDLNKLIAIVISHGHYDHIGGLLAILNSLKRKTDIITHPDIWGSRLNRKPSLREIGAGITPDKVVKAGGILKESDKPYQISDNVFTTGSVKRTEEFESDLSFLRKKNDQLVQDNIIDDMSIVIDLKSEGILILTGCCHAGIVNTIKHVIDITGNEKIRGIMGGFHLIGASSERLRKTSEYLKSKNVKLLIPLHCSGIRETCFLWQSLGNNVKFCGVGNEVILF